MLVAQLAQRLAASIGIADLLGDLLGLLRELLPLVKVLRRSPDHALHERLEGRRPQRIVLERAHLAAAGVDRVPEVARHLVAIGGVRLQDAEALCVQLLLRVLGHRFGLRVGGGHVAEDVLAERSEAVGARERDHRHAQLLRARRGGEPFGDAERPEDGDGSLLRELLDGVCGDVRLALGIHHLHLHLAASLQIESQGDSIQRLVGESLQVSGEGQHDADEIRPQRGALRRLLHRASAIGIRALTGGGEDVAGEVLCVGAVAGVELDARELERRGRPGRGLAVQFGDELGDVRRRRGFHRPLVLLQARFPLRAARRLERPRSPAHRFRPLSVARIRLRKRRGCQVLVLLAHLRGIHRGKRGSGLSEPRLDRRQLDDRGVLEGRGRPAFQEVLQRDLRFLQLVRFRERLTVAEEGLVEQIAVPVALDEAGELLRREVVLAGVERRLGGAELDAGSLLVRNLAPVDHHGARGRAGEQQQQDRGRPLHGDVPCTAFRSHAPQPAWLCLQLLHVRAFRRREVEQRIGQPLVDLRLAEDDLVHVSLRVGDDAREHLSVLCHHEEELLDARHGLERRQLQPVAWRQSRRHRHRFRRELLQQVSLAPQEREGAAQLFAAEVALDLRFLVVGPPDPQRPTLDVERAPVRTGIVPAHQSGLLHLNEALGVLGAPDRHVRVMLPEAGGEIPGVRVEGLHALGEGAAGVPGGHGEKEGEKKGGHGGWTRVRDVASSAGRASPPAA